MTDVTYASCGNKTLMDFTLNTRKCMPILLIVDL